MIRIRCSQALGLFSFLLIVALARDARAQQVDIQARAGTLVGKGLQSQEAGRYDEAIGFYKAAYDLLPHPDLLFNLGQAHRLKGDRVTALDYYRKYIALQPNGRAAKEARKWTEQIERDMRAEAVAEEARRAEVARLAEEARQAEAARQAETARKAAEAEKAKDLQARIQEEPLEGDSGRARITSFDVQERRISKEKIAALSLGIAGATTIGVALYFKEQSADKIDELEALIGIGYHTYEYEAHNLIRRSRRYDSYEANLMLVGGSTLIIGTALWVLSPPLVYSEASEASPWRRPASLVFGAAGVACVAASLYLRSDLEDEEYDYYERIKDSNDLIRDDVKGFAITGSAFLAAGVYLWLSSPSSRAKKPVKAASRLLPTLDDQSAGFVLSGQF